MDPTGITNTFDPKLLLLTPLVVYVTNVATNLARTHLDVGGTKTLGFAFGVAFLTLALLAIATGVTVSPANAAQAVILAALAVGGSLTQQKVSDAVPAAKAEPASASAIADELEARRQARVLARLHELGQPPPFPPIPRLAINDPMP